ncbi:MAG: right-handed parallel beta-helix repeat-containing protein [Proteobacteria bacterium]|nr:right-handed parallel beta-helix repeat-containing protein [Pseudomonadota bacterium]MBU4295392.1 right-handed parallel beta-helix repeat-containing protein [Pseudomonadota bacterium]MCG2748910.1 right-handed parallel beta-helix repeat-containing protein [Desulfobulbaceae bacterium]
MWGKKAFWISLVGLLFLVVLHEPAFCATYYVPDDYPTIQAAVDATWGGETIIVRAGTYTGEGNKNITINKIITIKSEEGPENTIIDCEGVGRGVSFTNVSNLTVLDGFKIINGSVAGTEPYGGGIYCSSASPQISNCIINDNSAGGTGGGIYSTGGTPSFTNCIINDNSAGGTGGGVYTSSGGTFSNCIINDNTAGNTGGGIYSTGTLSFTNCTIISNSTGNNGGGICSYGGAFTNCAITGNSATGNGGGIYIGGGAHSFTNCTFAWNNAKSGGGLYSRSSSYTYIRNSIFYFDSALQEIYSAAGTITITYSDIMGGYTGEGNIDENPEFVAGGDFHLSALSPCIDTASPDNAPDSDLDDELRPAGEGYDMGADEFDGIPAPPPLTPSRADLNNDGVVDGLDVALFAAEFGRAQ